MFIQTKNKGFTLIELLVVVAIIGLLSSIVISSLNDARAKARNAKRALEMKSILTAINLYYNEYGCLPITRGSICGVAKEDPVYNEYEDGHGWDYSSKILNGSFMNFLKRAGFMNEVPVDPINDLVPAPIESSGYAFKYYCYGNGPKLVYWTESPRVLVYVMGSATSPDVNYICN